VGVDVGSTNYQRSLKGAEMADYSVNITNLSGFAMGETVTGEQIEKAGGNTGHLIKLGAISPVKQTKPSKKEG